MSKHCLRYASSKELLIIWITITFLAGIALTCISQINPVTGSSTENLKDPAATIVQNAQIPNDNATVYVSAWIINAFDYQYTTGDYTLDMYTFFFWTNSNISTVDWHFANGYPITPTSVTLVSNGTQGETKYEVYRATARLDSAPDAINFPFDEINITVTIDLLTHGNNISLQWLVNETGIDPGFKNPGWKTTTYYLNESLHSYPMSIKVPEAQMVIVQERQRPASSLAPFVPPSIFALVCAISFLFSLSEMGSVGLRIGLNTSMLVTTLLFSFGVGNNIPPSSGMVFYTIFLLTVLIFMVCNLIVTVVGVVGWVKYQDKKRTQLANKLGFLISIAVPAAVFITLYLVR